MSRGFIRLGDPTSHGGKVVSATARMIIDGIPVALWGDSCTCPIPGHTNCIICEGEPGITFDGIPVALEGHKTSCGGILISTASGRCGAVPVEAAKPAAGGIPLVLVSSVSRAEEKHALGVGELAGAWPAVHTWDSNYIDKYRNYVKARSNYYQSSKSKATCEDFALQILMDYAYENSLPVIIVNGAGVFDSRSSRFNGKEDYVYKVKRTTGALDLSKPENTLVVSQFERGDVRQLRDARCGDLLLYQALIGNVDSHVQVITETHDEYIRVAEGNMWFRKASSDPHKGLLYGGQRVHAGTIDSNSGDKFMDGEKVKKSRYKVRSVNLRRWNFMRWNQ